MTSRDPAPPTGASSTAAPAPTSASSSSAPAPTGASSRSAQAADAKSAVLPVWHPAYIGLGSNLNDPRAQVLAAVEKLRALPNTRVIALSKLYGSKPFGPVKQG